MGGHEVEVDTERTSLLYKRTLDWCQCDFCTNAHIARARHTPVEQVEKLHALGVDPWRPCLSEFGGNRSHDPSRHTRRLSCWFLYGRLIGESPTPKLRFDRWNWMWADTNRAVIQAWDSELERLDGDPDLIYVFASNVLPWLYGEVSGFRIEYAVPCSRCGSRFRETGYLKRRSLIPQWEGMPELNTVLLERKLRVYVEFCTSCGHMEHRVVPNTPPFRKRNRLLRDERKAARTRWQETFGSCGGMRDKNPAPNPPSPPPP